MKIKGVIICAVDHQPEGAPAGAVVDIVDEYEDADRLWDRAVAMYPNCSLTYEPAELEDE